jgi:hypothetical protein
MQSRVSVAVSWVSFAFVVAACSSSSDDKAAPVDAGNVPTDAGAPVVDAGVDSGVDAGPDGKQACDLLSAAIKPSQPQVTQTPSNSHPLAEAPAPAGGTILDGTYRLTAVNSYFEPSGATPGGRTRSTLELKGGLWESITTDYDAQNMPATTNSGGGAYIYSGTEASPAPGRPGGPSNPSCGSGQFFSGPSGGLSGIGFTATPTTLTFIRPNLPKTVIIVSVFTKDP